MKRLCCLFLLLLPLTGCAFFDDCVAFTETEWHRFADPNPPSQPAPVRACGDGAIMQTGATLPAQTQEPPR